MRLAVGQSVALRSGGRLLRTWTYEINERLASLQRQSLSKSIAVIASNYRLAADSRWQMIFLIIWRTGLQYSIFVLYSSLGFETRTMRDKPSSETAWMLTSPTGSRQTRGWSRRCKARAGLDWVRFNVPPPTKHSRSCRVLVSIWSNDPTNSVKALKED